MYSFAFMYSVVQLLSSFACMCFRAMHACTDKQTETRALLRAWLKHEHKTGRLHACAQGARERSVPRVRVLGRYVHFTSYGGGPKASPRPQWKPQGTHKGGRAYGPQFT